jgi:hypothetical protein
MALRLNAIASETKMKLREAIQQAAKFDAAVLSVLVTDYAYEARPCLEHMKPVLDQFSRVPWVVERPIGPGMVQEMRTNQPPEWFETMCNEPGCLRFCRFYDDEHPVAITLCFHQIGTDCRFRVVWLYTDSKFGAYKTHAKCRLFPPEDAEEKDIAAACAQNELVADFV